MPRYFLHIKDRKSLVRDPEGQDFADLVTAKQEAAAAARELMSEDLLTGAPLGLHREMIIEDEQGVTLASLSFTEALPAED
jgi:Domain of unknown function (DUF6894)